MHRILILLLLHLAQMSAAQLNVRYLEPGESVTYVSQQQYTSFAPDLRIYCYRGQNHSIGTIFQSARFQLAIDNEDFVQYEGDTPDAVKTHYDNQRTIFSFNVMNTSKKKTIKINPFNQTCIGIETVHKYTVHLNVLRLDFAKLILLGVGLLLFIYAGKFSQTPLFYYLSGIFLGIFASFLVLVYFSSKLFPRRPMMYGVMIGGWTLGLYFLQMLWEHLNVILIAYQAYVFWYVIGTGFISFVICYRMGPPKNQRSKDLIKWGLQLIANIMIFYSSNYREASVSIMIAIIFWHYFPVSMISLIRSFWIKRFPPKPKLLTSEEFYEQGVLETTKALEELKSYCSSPQSKPWKMMTKLKDPQRFAEFIEGSPHLLDEEILDYETSHIEDDTDSNIATDDDSDNENDADVGHSNNNFRAMNNKRNGI